MLKIYQTSEMEKALPVLVEKIYGHHHRLVIWAKDETEALAIDQTLWAYKPISFLPHGCAPAGDIHPQDYPIWIDCGPENKNQAQVLLVTQLHFQSSWAENYQQILCFVRLDEGPKIQAHKAHIAQWWAQVDSGPWIKKSFS